MKTHLTKIRLVATLVALVCTAGSGWADPMEAVIGLDVHNPQALLAAMDRLYSSKVMSEHKATLWAATFRGNSQASHTLVVEYDSYADYERLVEERNASQEWDEYLLSLRDVLDLTSTRMAIQRFAKGSGWRNHGALVAFSMTVRDPATYATAFTELVDSMDNPGSVRLMEMRFGGQGTTHVVLISAPGPAALNDYLDKLLSSDAYSSFARKVGDIRTINNVTMLRRVMSFGN